MQFNSIPMPAKSTNCNGSLLTHEDTNKMARDRGASLLTTQAEAASFFGPKIPDVIKKMVSALKQTERSLTRKLIQVAVKDIEGGEIPENAINILSTADMNEDVILPIYAGILQLLKLAFRLPTGALKQDVFKKELLELKMPEETTEDLCSVIFSSKQEAIDKKCVADRTRLPKLESLKWRVDVAISTSVLNRVLEPTILMEMKLENDRTATFEVPVAKFHELRYSVASVLKEMEELEEKSILKI